MQQETNLKVVHVITDLQRGGAEGALSRLCLGLKKQGVYSRVISLRGVGPIGAELQDKGIEVLALRLPRPSSLFKIFRAWNWIRKANIVDAWLYHANFLASLLSLFPRRPVIWNIRGAMQDYEHESLKTKLVIWLNKILSWRPRRIVFNSERAKIIHEGLGLRRNTRVLFNGFNPPRPVDGAKNKLLERLGLKSDRQLILSVGRYHRHKDYGNLCRAGVQMLEQGLPVEFVLVGRDLNWDHSSLAEAVPENFRGHFHFMGEQSDVAPFYSGCDYFVLSSLTESFPNVIGEAMSYGLICVSTDVGAVKELMASERFICPAQDPAALAATMTKAIQLGEQEKLELKNFNRTRMREEFSMDRMIQNHLKVFQDAVSNR